jgi:hypothetical protein
MGVLRGGPGNSQSDVALHNQTVVVTYGNRHSSKALSSREVKFSQGIQGIGARLLKNSKFVS